MAARAIGVVALLFVAWIANFIAKQVILRAVMCIVRRTSAQWDDALMEAGVFTRLSHVAPALVIRAFGGSVLGDSLTALRGWTASSPSTFW